jgi:hypothetical protein
MTQTFELKAEHLADHFLPGSFRDKLVQQNNCIIAHAECLHSGYPVVRNTQERGGWERGYIYRMGGDGENWLFHLALLPSCESIHALAFWFATYTQLRSEHTH